MKDLLLIEDPLLLNKRVIKAKNDWRKRFLVKMFWTSLFLILATLFLLPFYWMVISSLRSSQQMFTAGLNPFSTALTLNSYKNLFATMPYATWYLNSLIMLTGYSVLALFTCTLGGFALAKYKFHGRNLIFIAILCSQMIPFHLMIIPLFGMLVKYHLIDTYTGVILPLAAHPFGIFFMRQYLMGISDEILEASRIDGTNEYQLFEKIALPLAKPAIGTMAIFFGMEFWNNLLWPMIVMRSESKLPLAVGVASLVGQLRPQYDLVMAASFLSVFPVLILFIFLKDKFISGMAASGMIVEK